MPRRHHLPAAAKLAKVLGMLGSSNEHKVLVAGRQAEALRRELGVSWADLLNTERVEVNGHALEPLLTEKAVAEILGCEVRSLRGARSRGVGDLASLGWLKLGPLVRYRPSELKRWLAERERGWER
jgi:hypothetical protein